ncbi:hypothetical protein [Jannaschia sp. CCS1]|uniref:hypothetical protein n=1 Tax=Jannaschia sp. (strain CCS1) TaxID=290400 RepID=UPI00006BFFC0|nr:hypothetical protein [Jannaschia sp. CCS1]ABD54030.1 Integrins alpha chain [Jannaschia sp. CCS1]
MKSVGYAMLALLAAGSATAQTWQSDTGDSTALLYAGAFAPGGTTSFSCTTPSPQNVPLIETGDHESIRTDTPYDIVVGFNIDLMDPFTLPEQLDTVRIILDDVPYTLPRVSYSDFYGSWTVWMQMTDGLFPALTRAQSMVVDTGTGTAYAYPTDGLRDAVLATVNFCISGWEAQGDIAPRALSAWSGGQLAPAPAPIAAPTPASTPAPSGGQALLPGLSPAPTFPIPDQAPQVAIDRMVAQCQGEFSVDPSAVQAADVDGDGAPDYILNYSGVECFGGLTGRAYCGAANCQFDVFLSSRAYANPSEFLAIALDPVVDGQGRTGLLMASTLFGCADGACDTPFYWDGTQFTQ